MIFLLRVQSGCCTSVALSPLQTSPPVASPGGDSQQVLDKEIWMPFVGQDEFREMH